MQKITYIKTEYCYNKSDIKAFKQFQSDERYNSKKKYIVIKCENQEDYDIYEIGNKVKLTPSKKPNKFHIGDIVESNIHGRGKVIAIKKLYKYPIIVEYNDSKVSHSFTRAGYQVIGYKNHYITKIE